MAEREQRICEVCRERPATQFICYGDSGETRDLCLTCFEETASPEEMASHRSFDDALRAGKCQYCGSPAVTGSFYSPAPGIMADEVELWCKQCNMDLAEFHARPENALPTDDYPFDDEAAMERLAQESAKRKQRMSEFMKQKVAERRSKES